MGSGDRSIDPFVSPPENEETSPQNDQGCGLIGTGLHHRPPEFWLVVEAVVFHLFFLVSSVGLGQWRRVSTWVRGEAPTVHSHPTSVEHEVLRCPEFTPLVNPKNDGHGRFESSKNPGTAAINVLLGDAAIVAGRNIRDSRWKGGWWKVSLMKNVMVLAMKMGIWPRNRNWCTNVRDLEDATEHNRPVNLQVQSLGYDTVILLVPAHSCWWWMMVKNPYPQVHKLCSAWMVGRIDLTLWFPW